jgi:hypothetical protein
MWQARRRVVTCAMICANVASAASAASMCSNSSCAMLPSLLRAINCQSLAFLFFPFLEREAEEFRRSR